MELVHEIFFSHFLLHYSRMRIKQFVVMAKCMIAFIRLRNLSDHHPSLNGPIYPYITPIIIMIIRTPLHQVHRRRDLTFSWPISNLKILSLRHSLAHNGS